MTQETDRSLLVQVNEETLERIVFLAKEEGLSVSEMASKLLADEAEAQAGLARGPFSRNYMYRA